MHPIRAKDNHKQQKSLLIYPETSQLQTVADDLCCERQRLNSLEYHFTCMSAKTYCSECLPGTSARPQLYGFGIDPLRLVWYRSN